MSESPPVIDVYDLSKSFSGKVVVNRLSLRVEGGEIFGFLGPNGSGKTTFIRMLCGLLRPDGGRGVCLGHDLLKDAEAIRPQIGYMAQHFSLYEDLSVGENLDFMARIYGVEDRRRAIAEIVERMKLGPFAGQLAGTLSGGWQQRLALACCLLHKPRLLLLDEPTAGVDPKARRDFWDDIYALSAEGITTLISTHYMDEAERCHRLAYLAYGDLLASGSAVELVAAAGLTTWEVAGKDLHPLGQRLRLLPGVDQVVPFGNTLHVSGRNRRALEASLRSARDDENYSWTETETGLEEVFISLMQHREGD
ncbi:ABC-type multidrug transport system, ATPase component [Desulfuromonas soudanensis]|uniref:ABC-type multidrug transport system, ATPase component n=1 Tax=Desulfuromonas soudanensis TaxID=1603606 RepID=A0A0M4DJN2_9BACT|nr:ABC transporter ATP-binding protein [Desulfuromonas soudanensis]ALC17345.1 ABC-type multidrug transport system, ATPase component [Desulfuromonas soudanensis]